MSDANPFIAALAQAAGEPFFGAAVGIALISGLVRGFTGFGSALIYIPLISAIYGPRVAAPTLLLIDTLCALPFALHAAPNCNVREVTAVSIAGALALPVGVMALLWVDALTLRWFIAFLVLVALAALVAGWRYRGRPNIGVSLGAGALAGLGAGAVQIGAPPLVGVLARRRQQGRHRARQHHGLFHRAGNVVGRALRLQRPVRHADLEPGAAARRAVRRRHSPSAPSAFTVRANCSIGASPIS